MATPHVAAAAALLAAAHPKWTPARIKEQLQKTAKRLRKMSRKTWTPSYGSGLLDVEKALP